MDRMVQHKKEYRESDSPWTEDEDSSSTSSSDFLFESISRSSSPKLSFVKTKGELDIEDLPSIEYIKVSVKEKDLRKIGDVLSIVSKLVVIQATSQEKPLDIGSILFLTPNEPLGEVFEVFGQVCRPLYSVRFNLYEDIVEKGITEGTEVFFAPHRSDMTYFCFVDVLRQQKGSDASWKDNNEPPEEYLDYSDDEQERAAKLKRKGKNRIRETDDEVIPCKTSLNEKRTFSPMYCGVPPWGMFPTLDGMVQGCQGKTPNTQQQLIHGGGARTMTPQGSGAYTMAQGGGVISQSPMYYGVPPLGMFPTPAGMVQCGQGQTPNTQQQLICGGVARPMTPQGPGADTMAQVGGGMPQSKQGPGGQYQMVAPSYYENGSVMMGNARGMGTAKRLMPPVIVNPAVASYSTPETTGSGGLGSGLLGSQAQQNHAASLFNSGTPQSNNIYSSPANSIMTFNYPTSGLSFSGTNGSQLGYGSGLGPAQPQITMGYGSNSMEPMGASLSAIGTSTLGSRIFSAAPGAEAKYIIRNGPIGNNVFNSSNTLLPNRTLQRSSSLEKSSGPSRLLEDFRNNRYPNMQRFIKPYS